MAPVRPEPVACVVLGSSSWLPLSSESRLLPRAQGLQIGRSAMGRGKPNKPQEISGWRGADHGNSNCSHPDAAWGGPELAQRRHEGFRRFGWCLRLCGSHGRPDTTCGRRSLLRLEWVYGGSRSPPSSYPAGQGGGRLNGSPVLVGSRVLGSSSWLLPLSESRFLREAQDPQIGRRVKSCVSHTF